jgi:hypothetical protein
LLAYFFDPEDGGDMFLRNVGNGSHGVIFQKVVLFFNNYTDQKKRTTYITAIISKKSGANKKTALFITTPVRTSNPTCIDVVIYRDDHGDIDRVPLLQFCIETTSSDSNSLSVSSTEY